MFHARCTTLAWLAAGVVCNGAHALDIPDAVYPTLPKQAAAIADFVPSGWKLEYQVVGDLNRDVIPDLVLVLRENNPKNLVKQGILGENPLNTNPRILAVALGPAPFKLVLQNHKLIPRRDMPTMEDPLEQVGIAISRGALRVKLSVFMSAGSWSTSNRSYSLRFQNGRFELIGYDYDSFHRGAGEYEGISINYLTGKVRMTRGDMDNLEKQGRSRTIPKRALLTIDQIENGLEFEPK